MHAYLIVAHNEPRVLRELVHQLDDERNDIFIHLDASADAKLFEGVRTEHSELFWIPRKRVTWGGEGMVDAELRLLRFAKETRCYSRYHILSGTDLAIKSQDYIHHFCDVIHAQEELVDFSTGDLNRWDLNQKTRYFYFFFKRIHASRGFLRKVHMLLERISIGLQRKLNVSRDYPLRLAKGPNWVSITDALCSHLLEKEQFIRGVFRQIVCVDEIFLQSIVANSLFAKRVCASMRAVDWSEGGNSPRTLCLADLEWLRSSPCLFARKFSYEKDPKAVEAVRMMTDKEN